MLNPTVKLILSFLLGMLSGAILMVLIYLLFVMLTIKKRSYIIETQNANIKEEQVLELIKQCKENYKYACKSDNKIIKEGAFKRHITTLAEDIAKLFFPESKRPLAELTMDEILMLNKYITARVEEIIDRPGLRFVKRLSLNTIIDVVQTKNNIENSKPIKAAEKYNLKDKFKTFLGALNCINPVYWFKKLVVDNMINFVFNKIKLMAISISGQELYKVYSKKAFEPTLDETITDEEIKDFKDELNKIELSRDEDKK